MFVEIFSQAQGSIQAMVCSRMQLVAQKSAAWLLELQSDRGTYSQQLF